MPRGAGGLGPKSMMADTQWMSAEQAQKLSEDKANRVFRWSDPRKVEEMPGPLVYRIVKHWREFVERLVDETPELDEAQIERLIIDEEKRRTGNERAAYERFRTDLPTMFKKMTQPVISSDEMTKIYELILAKTKQQQGVIQVTDEEMQVFIINRNKRDPTPEEREKIARGQAYNLDGVGPFRKPAQSTQGLNVQHSQPQAAAPSEPETDPAPMCEESDFQTTFPGQV